MKSSEKEKRPARSVLLGVLAAVIIEAVVLLLLAALTASGKMAENNIAPVALGCGALSCFIGSFLCARSVKSYRLPCALGTGAAFVMLNACLGSLFSGSGGGGNPFVCVPAYLGASVLAALFSVTRRRKKP